MAAPIPIDPAPEPERFPATFAAAWHSRSGAALAELFTEDSVFVNVTGLCLHGRAEIAKPHDRLFRTAFAETILAPSRTATRRLSDINALVRCRFTLSRHRTYDGSIRPDRLWITSFVLEKRATGWLALSAQFTGDTSSPEALIAAGRMIPVDHSTPRES
ncbi:SgcJ/EcaC family oxidoreductase [Mameliella sediminis]|uniref:SgcJ/EcaC family oxidoreductase n=1 Tax=Mameliella sediminis TaxID=2836866 RepID=UPI001C449FF5|nr:SgcJ/EcaC family oxidoreductase [Mameliella sediminis]MBV7396642.1 SgcJ/EcaC family oxidoreductase [Mameliella sediminis]MBY6162932.1 SgcJ/EcaC family oxidoreductase [Mameliella alba]MBY6171196.1 SgcJ/EcaC family oxidoreductase [Mameliella alba]MBY6176420.1 SgcJ/EcaC family oxidoreductase [Mameliella alba]